MAVFFRAGFNAVRRKGSLLGWSGPGHVQPCLFGFHRSFSRDADASDVVGNADAYDYDLPEDLIAQKPITWLDTDRAEVRRRDASRLLCVDVTDEGSHPIQFLRQCKFTDVASFLPKGSLLVANNTKVVHARLQMRKRTTGGAVELLVVSPAEGSCESGLSSGPAEASATWKCMVKGKNVNEGTVLIKQHSSGVVLSATILKRSEESSKFADVEFNWSVEGSSDSSGRKFGDVLEALGSIPLPPYMKRAAETRDAESYQTIYAGVPGSVAAPTAGLHFTEDLVGKLERSRSICLEKVTLHTGPGTFVPLQSSKVQDHHMHTETFSVTREALANVCEYLREGKDGAKNLIAVGTTTVRTLETLYWLGLRRMLREPGGKPMDDATPLDQRDDEGKSKVLTFSLDQWEPYDVVRDACGQDWSKLPDAWACYQNLLEELDDQGKDGVLGQTSLLIMPGYRFRVCDQLFTNFHAPKTTLMLLVSAFASSSCGTQNDLGLLDRQGRQKVLHAYEQAVKHRFRFLSYGDACFFARFKDLPSPMFEQATSLL
ncbi:S-adenosylmethionine:tRNA ribosyltransferase-isomerase [Chloropicon primus]|uniref:S-adenosylmethionine:tRNA ribosyltransferase-isomerase n=2 Tax=Chloropicon primus TaxID=1764295 RepID=A0A5B8MXY8_9CHLO|nr:S-adenosylmethionine:tRNA ribosyltransferase-isomerase [Chloropicon primus]UPR04665.1 S-adenosylmethionine:tRNA ribosyltransferase-isomerase [Chloropicon primus]|eukprot:QDZ25469.1 S-adenosylmethionine:tRNA ribosyltransferase-isomerase [Chloropicon primus]